MAETETGFVDYTITHPAGMSSQETDEMEAYVRARLQRKAREQSRSLADPEGVLQRVDVTYLGLMHDPEGRLITAEETTFRMAVTAQQVLEDPDVQAVEQEDGTWLADIPPGFPIVTVRHGLDSYDVRVRALDADGEPTGFHAFMPISLDAVEVVPLPLVAHIVIERPFPEEPGEAPQ